MWKLLRTMKIQQDFLREKMIPKVCVDWQGIVHYEFIPEAAMVNKERCPPIYGKHCA
jgi:hypothetical protein